MNQSQPFFATTVGLVSAVVVVTLLWGSPYPFIKLSYQGLHIASTEIWEQLLFAGYRFFVASLVVLGLWWVWRRRAVGLSAVGVLKMGKIALFQTFLQYVFVYIGLSLSSGMVASLLSGSIPFWQMLFAHFLYTEDRLTRRKVLALSLGMSGVASVSLSSGGAFTFGWGEVYLLLGAVTGTIGNLMAKNEMAHFDVFAVTGYQMLLGSLGLLAVGAWHIGFFPFHFSVVTGGMFGYLVLISVVAFLLWNFLLKYHPVSKLSLSLCMIPVVGVVFAAVLLHEPLRVNVLVAMGLIVSGIYLINRKSKEPVTIKSS